MLGGKRIACALLALAGCVSVHGPCRIEADASGRTVECREGGSTMILAPSRVIEATGDAASAARPQGVKNVD